MSSASRCSGVSGVGLGVGRGGVGDGLAAAADGVTDCAAAGDGDGLYPPVTGGVEAMADGSGDESAAARLDGPPGVETDASSAPAMNAATPAVVIEAAENGTRRRMWEGEDTRYRRARRVTAPLPAYLRTASDPGQVGRGRD
jgi:hypothetical protein